jgi:hypothetical protein
MAMGWLCCSVLEFGTFVIFLVRSVPMPPAEVEKFHLNLLAFIKIFK